MPHVRRIVLSFLALIAVGTALLSMPGVIATGTMPLVDAVFMATSAVCVTGLVTVDMGNAVTTRGHAILLALIQLGGLGIATAASVIILTGRRLSLAYEDMIDSSIAVTNGLTARRVVGFVILFTLAAEFAGALALFSLWTGDAGVGTRLWLSLFHAVSAFCNAGFSLFSDNLQGERSNIALNLVVMALIVLGGFGFMNLHELVQHIRARTVRWARFSLFLKVALAMTVALNGFGFLVLLAVESANAFAALPWGERMTAALFHAVTARTAGFETVPIASLTSLSLMVLVFLMYVGGGGGSCAGGIKVATLAVIVATFRSYVRNLREPALFGRRLAYVTQRKAWVLAMASLVLIFVGVAAVNFLDEGFRRHASGAHHLTDYLFEVVSAAGTVGLSTGITADLTAGAKLVLVVLMFVGRLGPLAVIEAWTANLKPQHFTNPEEVLPVG